MFSAKKLRHRWKSRGRCDQSGCPNWGGKSPDGYVVDRTLGVAVVDGDELLEVTDVKVDLLVSPSRSSSSRIVWSLSSCSVSSSSSAFDEEGLVCDAEAAKSLSLLLDPAPVFELGGSG